MSCENFKELVLEIIFKTQKYTKPYLGNRKTQTIEQAWMPPNTIATLKKIIFKNEVNFLKILLC